MSATEKKKSGVRALIWCALVILIGAAIFLVLSAFGVLGYWQAEKTPQALYLFKTSIDLYVFPAAMYVTHFIVFGLALFTTHKFRANNQ